MRAVCSWLQCSIAVSWPTCLLWNMYKYVLVHISEQNMYFFVQKNQLKRLKVQYSHWWWQSSGIVLSRMCITTVNFVKYTLNFVTMSGCKKCNYSLYRTLVKYWAWSNINLVILSIHTYTGITLVCIHELAVSV